jgi:formylglycine-generating enzyme required for sulfatase activity
MRLRPLTIATILLVSACREAPSPVGAPAASTTIVPPAVSPAGTGAGTSLSASPTPEKPPCHPGMVRIEHGVYQLGARKDEPSPGDTLSPQTYTLIDDICVDEHEVTVAQYRECVTSRQCELPAGDP